MKVICKNNTEQYIANNLRKYAYTQDHNGILDITPGKEYQVFGVRHLGKYKFFLVNTDTIHSEYPWWMPATLYEISDDTVPRRWTRKTRGMFRKDTILAPPAYHGNKNAIEDGDAAISLLMSIRDQSSTE